MAGNFPQNVQVIRVREAGNFDALDGCGAKNRGPQCLRRHAKKLDLDGPVFPQSFQLFQNLPHEVLVFTVLVPLGKRDALNLRYLLSLFAHMRFQLDQHKANLATSVGQMIDSLSIR